MIKEKLEEKPQAEGGKPQQTQAGGFSLNQLNSLEDITIVRLYNTNSSPLWKLPYRYLENEDEEDEQYFKNLAKYVGAKLVILLGQEDDATGIIMLDDKGMPILPSP